MNKSTIPASAVFGMLGAYLPSLLGSSDLVLGVLGAMFGGLFGIWLAVWLGKRL